MKILHINTKEKYISLIEQGRKITEIIEIRPKSKCYLVKNKNREYIKDNNGLSIPKSYDAIMFHSDKRSIVVKIESAKCEAITDSQGNEIFYTYKNENIKSEQIVYKLGYIYKVEKTNFRY